ncbi:MAG: hypothetical protein K6G84_15955, partial [Lachnospiraceae bacterium]|nr:hypothetical protein [Lachnospiraceae bacterium]
LEGIWDEDDLKREVKERKEREESIRRSKEPVEILKHGRILDVDDDDIKNGFKTLLEECYTGKLGFNEYIQFICNVNIMRKYDFPQYNDINWEKVIEGIETSISEVKKKEDYADIIKNSRRYMWIEGDLRKDFTQEELRSYDIIANFIYGDGIYFDQNRQYYLDNVETETLKVFAISEKKRFDRFDAEMAEVTANCYDKCSQADKNIFPNYFTGIWGNLDREQEFNKEKTVSGLKHFEKCLNTLRNQYEKDKKLVALISLDEFIDKVKRLLEKYAADKDI